MYVQALLPERSNRLYGLKSMSEARNHSETSNQRDPEIFSDKQPDPGPRVSGPEARLTSTPAATIPPEEIFGITRFLEKTASLGLKVFLLALTLFATGAGLTIVILMDLLDHKSGWLKELLQFIKEASKIVTK